MERTDIHIGQLIKTVFRSLHKDKDVRWLAEHLNCDRSNVYLIFKRNNIDIQLLSKIGNVLGYDFFLHLSEAGGQIHRFHGGRNEDESRNFELIGQRAVNCNNGIDSVRFIAGLWKKGDMGLPRNPERAFKFYKVGADCGDAECLFNCGEMYELGIGTMRDHHKAIEFYAKAAQKGHAQAEQKLR